MDRAIKILSSGAVIYFPVEKETILKAMNISHSHEIRINDAIIAQHAIEQRLPILTDNIKDFKRIKEIRLIPLS